MTFDFSYFWDAANLSDFADNVVYISRFGGEDACIMELDMVAEVHILFHQG